MLWFIQKNSPKWGLITSKTLQPLLHQPMCYLYRKALFRPYLQQGFFSHFYMGPLLFNENVQPSVLLVLSLSSMWHNKKISGCAFFPLYQFDQYMVINTKDPKNWNRYCSLLTTSKLLVTSIEKLPFLFSISVPWHTVSLVKLESFLVSR